VTDNEYEVGTNNMTPLTRNNVRRTMYNSVGTCSTNRATQCARELGMNVFDVLRHPDTFPPPLINKNLPETWVTFLEEWERLELNKFEQDKKRIDR
jgi:hypothetical protein